MSTTAVAIVGAGNVGCALAADLTLRGVEVRLYNRSATTLQAIREAGGVTASGQLEGHAPLRLITDALEEAVDGAEVGYDAGAGPRRPDRARAPHRGRGRARLTVGLRRERSVARRLGRCR